MVEKAVVSGRRIEEKQGRRVVAFLYYCGDRDVREAAGLLVNGVDDKCQSCRGDDGERSFDGPKTPAVSYQAEDEAGGQDRQDLTLVCISEIHRQRD